MSFLLDPPALVILGFVVARVNYLTVIFGERFLSRGASKRNIVYAGVVFVGVFWAYSSLLYLGVIDFPWPFPKWYGGPDWMLNSGLPTGFSRSPESDTAAWTIFATYPLWFWLGSETGYAGHRLWARKRALERERILAALVKTIFPKGGPIPAGGDEVDSTSTVNALLTHVPKAFSDGFNMLLFVFDSRFLVFAFTGRWKRFVDLDPDPTSTGEKRKYLEAWEANPYLVTVVQILRVISGFGYFTKPQVYKAMGFDGPLEPGDPPWYRAGGSPNP